VFISTGDQQGNDIIIQTGLKPGQEVVNTGELKLKNGTRVVINNSLPLTNDTPKGLGDE
jgi:membrane fusion protein (multidrug efflux system)